MLVITGRIKQRLYSGYNRKTEDMIVKICDNEHHYRLEKFKEAGVNG